MPALGWIPDAPKRPSEEPDWAFAAMPLKVATAPERHSNRDLVVDVLEQGGLGSCVPSAVLQAVRADHVAQLRAAGRDDTPALGSRLLAYYLARAVSRTTALDSGTRIRTCFDVLSKFGFCDEKSWPYSDLKRGARLIAGQWVDDDDEPPPYTQMPSTRAFQAAHDQRSPTQYRRIDSGGEARIDDLRLASANRKLPPFGMVIGKPYAHGAFDPLVPFDFSDGPPAGGHAMVVTGYNDAERWFDVLTSWGPFGGKAYARATYASAAKFGDIWVCDRASLYSHQVTL